MTRSVPLCRWHRWVRILAAVALALGLPPWAWNAPAEAAAIEAPGNAGYVVTATPTSGVSDGQTVFVNIKKTSTDPNYGLAEAQVKQCRLGVTYQSSPFFNPNADVKSGGANCPPVPISSSAETGVTVVESSSSLQAASTPQGDTIRIQVGAGAAEWTNQLDGITHETLSCGVGVPCALVVEVYGGVPGSFTYAPWVFPLSYRDDNVLSACGSFVPGSIQSAGSDRMVDAYIAWTVDHCQQQGQHGAETGASYPGEGEAMKQYSGGSADLVYTALGYDHDANLQPEDPSLPNRGRRPSIAVPIALNATVIAVGNGEDQRNKKVPYTSVKLTSKQASHMYAQGQIDFPINQVRTENPGMSDVFAPVPSINALPVVSASTESTSWLASRYFAAMGPTDWVVPPVQNNPRAGEGRPTGPSFATADPDFLGDAYTTNSLRGTIRKVLAATFNNTSITGGVWVLTDRATARALDLPIASLTNAIGAYVAPTRESMVAAVPPMVPDEDGMLVPDQNAVPSTPGAAVPYPLTFVEYALVPAEPLLDASCAPRADAQNVLTDWLNYLVGDGQQKLPAGMEALPPALLAVAHSAIDQVGKAPSTQSICKTPPVSQPTPPTTTPVVAPDTGGSNGYPSGSADLPGGSFEDSSVSVGGGGGGGTDGGGASSNPISSPSPLTTPSTTDQRGGGPGAATDVTASLPEFAGARSANGLVGALALLAVIGLVSGAALLTPGRRAQRRANGPGC